MKEITQKKISRRSFLRSSALASGGILIGVNFLQSCDSKTKMPESVEALDFKEFNAYIKIAENGKITIYSPNPEIGQGVKTSMPMIIAEELDVQWSDVTVEQAGLDTTNFKRQVAGGSQSIRFGWDMLRQTGATAKLMLVMAAAKKWGVPIEECKAENGIIKNSKGETFNYGQVVAEAALLEIPENVTLKSPSDFKIIGKDAVNVDIEKITSGENLFGLDYKVEGMLYAAVLRPPHFGGTLSSFDAIDAKAVDGVIDVIELENKIAVIAKNTWSALKAKNLLKAEWQENEAESTAKHNEILVGLLDGDDFNTMRKDGDVQKAFEEADEVIERTYESPFLPHSCMEPMNFFANVTADKAELVGPIQTPEGTKYKVAEKLGLNPDNISVMLTRMGGGFGRRLIGDFALDAAEISSAVKKPIKLVYAREDDVLAGNYRPAIKYRIAASIKDGKLTGYHLKEASINSNMYGLIPNFFPAGALENYQVDVANYQSNISTAPWRAPYTNFLASAEQSFFDELFEIMGVDPIKTRLELLEKVKGTTDEAIQYDADRMQKVIEMAVEKSGFGKQQDVQIYQGFSAYYCHNSHVAEVADVVLDNKGKPKVLKVTCVVDCGIVVNPTGAKNQVEGGVIDGIGHALYGNLTFENGSPSALNFDKYQLMRMKDAPKVEVHFMENEFSPTGLGEPALPPAGAAVANAIYKATGKRVYSQPYLQELS